MSITDFNNQFPDEAACLQAVFDMRYKDLNHCLNCAAETVFYRVKGRTCFACKWCGYQIYPLVGTIFQNTHVPLKSWLFVIYLVSTSKHGLSAAEVQRHIGVSYKTAFRMMHLIRKLMKQPDYKLTGTVEADEAYLGGEMVFIGEKRYWKNKASIVGVIERKGSARAQVVDGVSATTIVPYLKGKVREGSVLYTDQASVYHRAKRDYWHSSVNHSKHEYVDGIVHTNTIEGFWSHLKRSLRGTYHGVSYKYLQNYIDESVFRHNHRDKNIFSVFYDMQFILV